MAFIVFLTLSYIYNQKRLFRNIWAMGAVQDPRWFVNLFICDFVVKDFSCFFSVKYGLFNVFCINFPNWSYKMKCPCLYRFLIKTSGHTEQYKLSVWLQWFINCHFTKMVVCTLHVSHILSFFLFIRNVNISHIFVSYFPSQKNLCQMELSLLSH